MTARRQGYLYLLAAILFFLFGYVVNQYQLKRRQIDPAQFKEITLLKEARSLQPVHLQSAKGEFTADQMKGHWTWVFFGFTRCQQLCPTTMQQMHQAFDDLKARGVSALPSVYMVSIDPEREDIERVESYTQSYDDHFHGLYAKPDDLASLTKSLGIVYMKEVLKDSKDYNINHSGVIILLNPEGKVAGFFNMPHDPLSMAQEYTKLVG